VTCRQNVSEPAELRGGSGRGAGALSAARVGHPGRRSIPVDADPDPDWLEYGLLDSVKSRRPVYRPTP
jgi:hypothetical protein